MGNGMNEPMFSPSSRARIVMYAVKGKRQAALLAALMYLSCAYQLSSSAQAATAGTGLSWVAARDRPREGWRRSLQQAAAAAPSAVPSSESASPAAGRSAWTPVAAPAVDLTQMLTPSAVAVPRPLAFFPLADGSFTSLYGKYGGQGINTRFVHDTDAGYAVLQCSQANDSMVELDDVRYGTRGPFAINLWMRPQSLNGALFEYVFSHNSTAPDPTGWGPNQVHLYFPEIGHPAFGIVRAIVKDSLDADFGLASQTFLDSDGQVAHAARNASDLAHRVPDLQDGDWHMITLSSQPAGGKGFRMYVDGALTAQMLPNTTYNGGDGAARAATGGAPMQLGGAITLCGRSRGDSVRGYTGLLAELALFDAALDERQAAHIYSAGLGPPGAASPGSSRAGGPAVSITPLAAGPAVAAALTVPTPVAFFPLADYQLGSDPKVAPGGNHYGAGYHIAWTPDQDAGTVVECSKAQDSTVVLDPVPYGTSGAFAINLWIKPGALDGGGFQYLFSHAASKYYPTGWEPNQVRVFYPEMQHPAFGVVRAILKDSTDDVTGAASLVFLDSDNEVGQLTRNSASPALDFGRALLQDGAWHMLTLSTFYDGTPGYAMFLDGQLTAALNGNLSYTGANGTRLHVDGGAPMRADGPIVLCGRSDNDTARGYNGRLTQLALFNTSLTPVQVYAIYLQGLPSPSTAAMSPGQPDPAASNAATLYGSTVCWFDTVSTPAGVPVERCQAYEACVPLNGPQLNESRNRLPAGAVLGNVGICTAPLPKGLLLPNTSTVTPPMAFFPLVGSLSTYPVPTYGGSAHGAAPVRDALFGGAARCGRGDLPDILLDGVPYAARGAFSVNLWFRVGNISGVDLEYLYSHAAAGTDNSSSTSSAAGWGPNQVQLYLPEVQHQAFGIVRAVVKDGSDVDLGASSAAWLDSDGQVGFNGPSMQRDDLRADPLGELDAGAFLTDGQWHMLTLTTFSNGTKGYRLFLDGALAGQMVGGGAYVGEDGVLKQVSGGLPANLSGPIHLCARSDDDTRRHFDGRIAYLGLWDEALAPSHVAALYATVLAANLTDVLVDISNAELLLTAPPAQAAAGPAAAVPDAAGGAASPAAAGLALDLPMTQGVAPQALTTASGPCDLPLRYMGAQLHSCVTIHGDPQTPVCWVRDAGWQVCENMHVSAHMALVPHQATPSPKIAAATLVAIPNVQRTTLDGQPCLLPTVLKGEVLADCLLRDGAERCATNSSGWAACAPADGGGATDPLDERATVAAARARAKDHRAVIAGSVLGGVAAAALAAAAGAAYAVSRGRMRPSATTFRKLKDERGDGRAAPMGPYPGPPLRPLGGAPSAGEVEMHDAGMRNGAAGHAPRSDSAHEQDAGDETDDARPGSSVADMPLRTGSDSSAAVTDDPEVKSVRRKGAGVFPTIRSSETRIVPSPT